MAECVFVVRSRFFAGSNRGVCDFIESIREIRGASALVRSEFMRASAREYQDFPDMRPNGHRGMHDHPRRKVAEDDRLQDSS